MRKRPATVASLLHESWTFYRKNTVFNSILLWLLIVPIIFVDLLDFWTLPESPSLDLAIHMFLSVLGIFVSYWGFAATLLVGKRMIQNKAGRSRSSLLSVLRESAPVVLPLLFTSILRGCFFFYRALIFLIPAFLLILTPFLCPEVPLSGSNRLSDFFTDGSDRISHCWIYFFFLLPLLIPAILYLIRTSFYSIALVAEQMQYRDALRRSMMLMRGKFAHVLSMILSLSCILLLPPTILSLIAQTALLPFNSQGFLTMADIVCTTLTEFGALLFTLSLIALYGKLRSERPVEVKN